MQKRFNVDLRITTSNPDVVAFIGAVAEAVEKQYEGSIEDMSVDTRAYAWKPDRADDRTLGQGLRDAFASTQPETPPPAEPDPGQSKAETPRKRGRVKPEVREPEVREPEAAPPVNLEPPLSEPAIEGADAELSEPVTSGTRELTRDEVFEALRALVVGKGNAAAVRALQFVGVNKFSDCPTDRLADLFDAIQKEAA